MIIDVHLGCSNVGVRKMALRRKHGLRSMSQSRILPTHARLTQKMYFKPSLRRSDSSISVADLEEMNSVILIAEAQVSSEKSCP